MIENKFKDILKCKNMRITQLSNLTGISRTTLTSLYYNRTEKLSLEVLDKLCEALNCGISDIFIHNKDLFEVLLYYKVINGTVYFEKNITLKLCKINVKDIIKQLALIEECNNSDIIICNIIKL